MSLPVVALVGRPNVGKSTLFNRIVGAKKSVVHSEPGVTRDRVMEEAEWYGQKFTVIDTGGIGLEELELGLQVRVQAEKAIADADVILLILDVTAGVTMLDLEVAEMLRRQKKPVMVIANKVDDPVRQDDALSMWELGLGEPVPVSAEHGLGINDLLDRLCELLPETKDCLEVSSVPVAIIGRPNVGKSSLLNAITGQDRVIVAELPGTTRDAIDVRWTGPGGQEYLFIDTAGMRRPTRIDRMVERFSVARALRAVRRAAVTVLVVDATDRLTTQERRIAGYIVRSGRALVVCANKWDLVAEGMTLEEYKKYVRRRLDFASFALVVNTSAINKEGIPGLAQAIDTAHAAYSRSIPTPELNRWKDFIGVTLPSSKGRQLKIFYVTQIGTKPPTFVLFANDPDAAGDDVRRFLERQLREMYGFEGTPIRLWVRRK